MASSGGQEANGALPNTAQQQAQEGSIETTDSGGVLPGEMSELRRVQLAHEGMRLLLCSELKQAEELFRVSRCVSLIACNMLQ